MDSFHPSFAFQRERMTTSPFHQSSNPGVELTRREKEIIALIADGRVNKEIAACLFVSPETVKKHLRNIFKKLGAHNKIEALTNLGIFASDLAGKNYKV